MEELNKVDELVQNLFNPDVQPKNLDIQKQFDDAKNIIEVSTSKWYQNYDPKLLNLVKWIVKWTKDPYKEIEQRIKDLQTAITLNKKIHLQTDQLEQLLAVAIQDLSVCKKPVPKKR